MAPRDRGGGKVVPEAFIHGIGWSCAWCSGRFADEQGRNPGRWWVITRLNRFTGSLKNVHRMNDLFGMFRTHGPISWPSTNIASNVRMRIHPDRRNSATNGASDAPPW